MATSTKKGIQASVYGIGGKASGKITLPESVFAVRWNPDLLHQVIVSMQSNARANTAHTKERDEVRGGGRKPHRQKGTGRARHGSRRSPIWSGGGVTFGPRNDRDYSKKINVKSRAQALAIALSRKLQDGQLTFFEETKIENPSAKKAMEISNSLSKIKGFETIGTKKHNNLLVIMPDNNAIIKKSFKNLGHVEIIAVSELNPVHIAAHRYIVFLSPTESIKFLESRMTKNSKIDEK